ncbi:unnamed protein product [Caenorhabditis sp. 36 PRJEB53466]|nr:unnamed protein product [Caenorhabditis sp. 36 PRJEB53466]
MVKEYSRSAADTHKYNKPELLRPFPVLVRTVNYLLELYSPLRDRREAVTSSEFSSVFSFVSDRLRSVRQDMIMQNLNGKNAILLMEQMLPFYIETDGFCKMDKCSSYDQKLHDFQLEECFGRWLEEVSSSADVVPDSRISACFFFRQLHWKPTLLQDLHLFRSRLSAETFCLVQDLLTSFYSNNYRRFFVLFRSLDPLLQHSLSDSVSSMRQSAMRIISIAFKTPVAKVPSRLISEWLGFPANLEFFDAFLRMYGVVPDEKGNILIASIKPVQLPDLDFLSHKYQ